MLMAPAVQELSREKIRRDFPVLAREINGQSLSYLDNAASMPKLGPVLDRSLEFEKTSYANVNRSVHMLSQESSEAYESTRLKLCSFLGVLNREEIVFTKGTTEAVNLVASSLGDQIINKGDSVVVTRLEHHANFVPWQQLCKRKGAKLQIVELTEDFEIDEKSFEEAMKDSPKIVSFSAMSNVLGGITNVEKLSKIAKTCGAIVFVDGAQWVPHCDTNLKLWPHVDFFCFSAHKLGGPNGVGVLWGRKKLLEEMSPYQFGGDMILEVRDQDTQFNELPYKFEAGTPPITGVIGLGYTLDYYEGLGRDQIRQLEAEICEDALPKILDLEFIKLIGPRSIKNRGPLFSFRMESVHPHDLGTYLDQQGIAVRGGHHCCQPLHFHYGINATTRASFSFFNELEEVDRLIDALKGAYTFFRR